MTHIPPLYLQGKTITLNELTIKQSLAIAQMPITLPEASTTAFIQFTTGQDSLDWTAEERMMTVAHYLAATSEDGPNFAVGELRFFDYFEPDTKPRQIEATLEVDNKTWRVRQLNGHCLESLERLQGGFNMPNDSLWLIGRIAAQLFDNDSPHLTGAELDSWLNDRITQLLELPESEFMQRLYIFSLAKLPLAHLFSIASDDKGLIALPKKGGAGQAPARFPVRSCIGQWALSISGKPH